MTTTHFRGDDGQNAMPVANANAPYGRPLPTTQNYSISAAITPTNTVPSPAIALGHALAVICTVAGNVKVGFMDGSTLTVPVAVGLTILPFRIAQVFTTGTTATATYAGLK